MKTDLQVGATVRFLNAIGGGRVARIQGDTAWIEDEDGFEIPTPVKECVVVEAGDTFIPEIRPSKLIQEKLQQGRPTAAPQERPRPQAQPPLRAPQTYRPDADKLSVRLAFLPIDRSQLGRTNYEAYLINESNFSLYYSYLSAVGTGYKVRSAGRIEPHEDILLEEFSPAMLNDLEQLAVQLLPFAPDRAVPLQEPVSVRLRLDTTKFFKLHAFRPNDYFVDEALLLPVVERGTVVKEVSVDAEALAEALQSKPQAPAPTKAAPPSQRPGEPLVIDLHSNVILETTAGLSPADILQYQLDFFHKTMKQHAKQRGLKLIFIHGKGDGILRAAIERELRHKYRQCRFQDASFQQYGYGATQVTIG